MDRVIPTIKGLNGPLGNPMQRVDGFYLYTVGAQIRPLLGLRTPGTDVDGTTMFQALFLILIAEGALEPLLHRSVFKLRTSIHTGQQLLDALRRTKSTIQSTKDKSTTLDFGPVYEITSLTTAFEAVLGAELSLLPLYLATQKAGYDMPILIDNGAACFPSDIATKVPDSIPDLTQGTKCLAFELYTAAGFHLHRANESVLHRYWDAVSQGAPRPKGRNIGDYLKEMDDRTIGNPKVKAALKDLKDLHRNPLIHPEHSLESADEAIALMNGIHTVMVHMLREMPAVSASPSVQAPGGIAPSTGGP